MKAGAILAAAGRLSTGNEDPFKATTALTWDWLFLSYVRKLFRNKNDYDNNSKYRRAGDS